MKLKIVVWFREVTAKQMAHGPAQVLRTASVAHALNRAGVGEPGHYR
jgi:hypothetical protein